MKRSIKTEAIVLRKRSLPNQDNLVTLLSSSLGKVTAVAKGIKKITSRRLPLIQTANLIHIILYHKENRYYLQESSLISGFSKIKKDSKKLRVLYQLLFVLERLLPENQVEPEVYKLIINFLIELSKSETADEMLLLKYLNKLLRILGFSKEDKSYEELIGVIEEIIHEKIPKIL